MGDSQSGQKEKNESYGPLENPPYIIKALLALESNIHLFSMLPKNLWIFSNFKVEMKLNEIKNLSFLLLVAMLNLNEKKSFANQYLDAASFWYKCCDVNTITCNTRQAALSMFVRVGCLGIRATLQT